SYADIKLTFSKFVVVKSQAAEQRVTELKRAIASRDPVTRRNAAKTESAKAADSSKSLSEWKDALTAYKYLAMGAQLVATGQNWVGALVLFHGAIAIPGWMRAQLGNGRVSIYHIKTAPAGIETGKGPLKRAARTYNRVLSWSPVDSSGQHLADIVNSSVRWVPDLRGRRLPVMRNPARLLRIEEGATAAHNRRRVLLLTTALAVPIATVILPLLTHSGSASASNKSHGVSPGQPSGSSQHVEPHADGAEAPAGGRMDPTLAREGFRAVEVFAGDVMYIPGTSSDATHRPEQARMN